MREIFQCISALQQESIESSVVLIKSIDTNSAHVKSINIKAIVAIVDTCYETLIRTLNSTADIVLSWLEEDRESVSAELNFPHLIAMVMMAKKKKDWFQPNNKGE